MIDPSLLSPEAIFATAAFVIAVIATATAYQWIASAAGKVGEIQDDNDETVCEDFIP